VSRLQPRICREGKHHQWAGTSALTKGYSVYTAILLATPRSTGKWGENHVKVATRRNSHEPCAVGVSKVVQISCMSNSDRRAQTVMPCSTSSIRKCENIERKFFRISQHFGRVSYLLRHICRQGKRLERAEAWALTEGTSARTGALFVHARPLGTGDEIVSMWPPQATCSTRVWIAC
jgi:hypothetical protein